MDFETALHDDLGQHYQLIMKKYKNGVSADVAIQAAAILTAAQLQASYMSSLQQEITLLRQTMIKLKQMENAQTSNTSN